MYWPINVMYWPIDEFAVDLYKLIMMSRLILLRELRNQDANLLKVYLPVC